MKYIILLLSTIFLMGAKDLTIQNLETQDEVFQFMDEKIGRLENFQRPNLFDLKKQELFWGDFEEVESVFGDKVKPFYLAYVEKKNIATKIYIFYGSHKNAELAEKMLSDLGIRIPLLLQEDLSNKLPIFYTDGNIAVTNNGNNSEGEFYHDEKFLEILLHPELIERHHRIFEKNS